MKSLSHEPPNVRPLGQRSSQDWARELRDAIRNPHELCQELGISSDIAEKALEVNSTFELLVPRPFVDRMEPGNPRDPLLLQVLPQADENRITDGFTHDPVGDLAASQLPGLLQKYHGRALLITSPACAIHCRYCFRREFPYQETPKGVEAWLPAIEQIALDHSISEVILSGGDPFMLVDETIEKLVLRIDSIPHVKRLRIHSRLPVVIPQRITDRLVKILTTARPKVSLVVHTNHANELDASVAEQLGRISSEGIILLNQSVLLRGINDSLSAQVDLSERLIQVGIVPYYLHHLDRVSGTAHFNLDRQRGLELINRLRQLLPGYMVPRYVVEEAGKPHKTLLA